MVYAAKWFYPSKGYEAAKIAWPLLPGKEDSCDQNISSKIHRQKKTQTSRGEDERRGRTIQQDSKYVSFESAQS